MVAPDARHLGIAGLGGSAVTAGLIAAGAPMVTVIVAAVVGLLLFGGLGMSTITVWEGTPAGRVVAGLAFGAVGLTAVGATLLIQ